MTATPGLDAWAARQESRCAGCGYHLTAQQCICAGQAAKSRILAAVNDSTPDDVKARIDAAILRVARLGKPFSANDCRNQLEGVPGPAIGPRFGYLRRRGLIEPAGHIPSSKGNTNGHEIKQWRSVA